MTVGCETCLMHVEHLIYIYIYQKHNYLLINKVNIYFNSLLSLLKYWSCQILNNINKN